MRSRIVSGCAIFLFAATAGADWLQATSDHFVIYGNESSKSIRDFSERLELFRAAMASIFPKQQAKPSPSNRVTIFIVDNRAKVRELARTDNRFTAGFYVARAGASVAVVPTLDWASSSGASGATILYHEYAHHFMYGLTSRAYPRWFSEGFAEFFGSVKFPIGSVGLGAPAMHRADELVYARDVPIRKLLDYDGGLSDQKQGYNAFYGQSWLLFHYMVFAPERAGQLKKYQQLLASGLSALDAAEGAFGDLDRLEQDMESYQERRRLAFWKIDRKDLAVGPIEIRSLSRGEEEIMPTVTQSRLGVTAEEALALLPEARRVAALYPGEAAVLAALAEAEFDAGNVDAAIAAADLAIGLDPKRVDAQVQKGYALFRKAEEERASPEAWKTVRSQFLKANKLENDNPIPLVEFYRTYLEQGVSPTANAVRGLEWAMTLAPFDASLRWLTAQQMITDGRLKDAARTLGPLALSPHPGEFTQQAADLLQRVESEMSKESQNKISKESEDKPATNESPATN